MKIDSLADEIAAIAAERDELLSALKAVVYSAHPRKAEHPAMFQAWQQAHAVIARADGDRSQSQP